MNGGYVRDLLLGKAPDDLDLSLCLRECAPDMTLVRIMDLMEPFARRRPDLDVSSVKVMNILSDTSKEKNIDTAKAHLGVGHPVVRIEVDFMPTIGEETYDDTDRVPTRDVRGTAEQDALRRDLTIGALLIEVTAAPDAEALGAHAAAEAMSWRLLDYYGGLADLRDGVLRSPYPSGRAAAQVFAEVIRSSHEQDLATQLGLAPPPATLDAAAKPALVPGTAEAAAAAAAAAEEERVLQVVWWVKVLRDDPLRVLRAMRFAAKLDFTLHETFWTAVPFALPALQTKVAGARKSTELFKIAKAGRPALLDFLSLSFGRPLPGGGLPCLAPALFGGADAKGAARFLAACDGFDGPGLVAAAAALPTLQPEEDFGACLAAATYACTMPPQCSPPGGASGADGASAMAVDPPAAAAAARGGGGGGDDDEVDATCALAAAAALEEVTRACEGLCASNEVRQAATTPLMCVEALLQPPQPQGQHTVFAACCGAPAALGGAEVSAAEFCALVHLWDTLKLDKIQQGKRGTGYLPAFALALARQRCSAATAAQLDARLAALSAPGPEVSGKSLLGIELLPPHMRGTLMSQLNVLCRLRGEPVQLVQTAQLTEYLSSTCDGLLERLYAEWYVDKADAADAGGASRKRELKTLYAPQRGGRKK